MGVATLVENLDGSTGGLARKDDEIKKEHSYSSNGDRGADSRCR